MKYQHVPIKALIKRYKFTLCNLFFCQIFSFLHLLLFLIDPFRYEALGYVIMGYFFGQAMANRSCEHYHSEEFTRELIDRAYDKTLTLGEAEDILRKGY